MLPENQGAKARRLLETALANGAVPATLMEQIAEDHGISMKTFNRAKESLGAISLNRHGHWYWELPIDVE